MSTRTPEVRFAHPHVLFDERMRAFVVGGTRLPVRRLFLWQKQGTSIEVLHRRYPHIGWAKLLDALSFAYDNEDLIRDELDRSGEAPRRG